MAPTMQAAIERWDAVERPLRAAYRRLHEMRFDAVGGSRAFDLELDRLAPPLPRAVDFIESYAYLNYVELASRAHRKELPQSFYREPYLYHSQSDRFLSANADIPALDEAHGIDFEATAAAIVDGTPQGSTSEQAAGHIRLLLLANDVSLRNLAAAKPDNLGLISGGKPVSTLSPVAVTPDALGSYWEGGKIHLPLVTHLNNRLFGNPNAGVDMNFDFPVLVASAARDRDLPAGALISAGLVSNRDPRVGSGSIAERRLLETMHGGRPSTPFLRFGDRVRIEMLDADGKSIFGAIDQRVIRHAPA